MTINHKQAKQMGYRQLTVPYNLPNEQWMMDNVIKDMKRGNIDYALVGSDSHPEVWRKGMKMGDSLVAEAVVSIKEENPQH